MGAIGDMVRELIAAGADPAVAAEVVASAYRAGFDDAQMSTRHPPDIHPTSTIEKRRAWDREYRRKQRNVHPTSTRHPPDPPDNADRTLFIKEVNKKEKKERATRIPPDWSPSPEDEAAALKEGLPSSEIAREAEKFRDYWCGVAGAKGCKLDWAATWRNHVRRACEFRGFAPANSTGPPPEYRPPPGSGLPTHEEMLARHAERRKTEGTTGAGADLLAPSVGVPREKQNGVDTAHIRHTGIRRMGEIFSPARLDALRDSDA